MVNAARGARLTRRPLTYAARQLVANRPAAYPLRASGLTVWLRHGSPDCTILNQIFGGTQYVGPPAVQPALRELGETPRVLDLGGHVGLFGAYVFGRFPAATVLSVEPDPANAQLLRCCIRDNGLDDRWTLVEACASNRPGRARLAAGLSFESHVTSDNHDSIEVEQVDAFELATGAQFVKLDIEGSEWPILGDERLRDLEARVLTMEWHAVAGAPDNPREGALEALRGAGYETTEDFVTPACGTLWAWRP